jgi:hypothetical protein
MTKRKIKAEEKTHATLGASSASRWMNCPGSVALSETMPLPGTSIHAEMGTAAHALAEKVLERMGQRMARIEPHIFLGLNVGGKTSTFEVTEEMADAVQVFTDFCTDLALRSSEYHVEKRFNLNALKPPVPMFGTADFVAYFDSGDLHVVDFKYGQGVVVDVEENVQLRYYALGAALTQEKMASIGIQRVHVTIIQPRAAHPDGPIRTETFSFPELLGFAGDLLEAARATLAPDAPLHAGSWCRWCPASGNCTEQMKSAQLVAQTEFVNLPANTLPAPGSLEPEQFSDILGKLHILENWASAMRAFAQAKLERGEAVPGWKLVQKRATRKWGDEENVIEWLKAKGFTSEEILISKAKSPAQVEKLLGKDKKSLPPEFIIAESSGLNMVPATDPRTEVLLGPGHEFAALPAGE